jgi:hypothetical protein
VRIFWSLIAILVLATAGLLIVRRLDSAPTSTPTPEPVQVAKAQPAPSPPPPQPTAAPTAPAITPRQPDPATTPTPVPQSEPAQPTPTTPQPEPKPAQPDPVQPEQPAAAPAQPETPTQPTPTPPTDKPAEQPPVAANPATAPDVAKPAETPATLVPAAADTTIVTPPATITAPGAPKSNRFTPSPEALAAAEAAKSAPTLVKQADGTTLVADRFVIKGDGTKESPYEVTWEQLMSAQETYKPRLGLKIIPGWLNLIHDKWVKVSGYVAFPVMAQGPDEMLMMLNQWDGCCIGVPPTPYDAIEVKLNKPAEGETRLLIMGSVTGKLKVDPYLVKDWLVSLYIMDEAEVSKQTGAPMRESEVKQEHLAP